MLSALNCFKAKIVYTSHFENQYRKVSLLSHTFVNKFKS